MNFTFFRYLSWSLRIFFALYFLLSASEILNPNGNVTFNLFLLQYDPLLLIVVGMIEASGAILLLINRNLNRGMLILSMVMIYSIITHIINYDHLGFPFLNIAIMGGFAIVHTSNMMSQNWKGR